MKKELKEFIRIVVLLLAFAAMSVLFRYLFAPPYPPYKREICTATTDYMQVNDYVEELLQNKFINFLPDELQPGDGNVYYYDYSRDDQELHLTLYLEQSFDTETQLNNELVRIKSFPHLHERNCRDRKYVIFSMPEEEMIMYYMSKVRANNFTFAVARVDTADNKITYLLSYEYDNRENKAVTVAFLKTYMEDIKSCPRILQQFPY